MSKNKTYNLDQQELSSVADSGMAYTYAPKTAEKSVHWNDIIDKQQRSERIKALRGYINKEQADEMRAYIQNARNEWNEREKQNANE